LDWSKAIADCLTDDADAKNFLAQAGAGKSACFGLAGIVNGIFKVHEEFLNDRDLSASRNSRHLVSERHEPVRRSTLNPERDVDDYRRRISERQSGSGIDADAGSELAVWQAQASTHLANHQDRRQN
jgi:hypothetical protein